MFSLFLFLVPNNSNACESVIGVVINEFLANPDGGDTDREWVELYNSTAEDVDVSGWILQGGSSGFSTLGEIPVGTMIGAGDYLLIGDELVSGDLGVEPDVIMSMSLGNAGSNADGIRIVDCNEQSVDTVIYGEPLNESDGWRESDPHRHVGDTPQDAAQGG